MAFADHPLRPRGTRPPGLVPWCGLVALLDAATVRRFAHRTHYRTSDHEGDPDVIRQRSTLSITTVGDVTVERPAGLAGPGPYEQLWGVVFYG